MTIGRDSEPFATIVELNWNFANQTSKRYTDMVGMVGLIIMNIMNII